MVTYHEFSRREADAEARFRLGRTERDSTLSIWNFHARMQPAAGSEGRAMEAGAGSGGASAGRDVARAEAANVIPGSPERAPDRESSAGARNARSGNPRRER